MVFDASGRTVRFFSRRFCARKASMGLRKGSTKPRPTIGTVGRTTGSNSRQWFVRSELGVGFAKLSTGTNNEAHDKPRNHRIHFPSRAFTDPSLDVNSAKLNH